MIPYFSPLLSLQSPQDALRIGGAKEHITQYINGIVALYPAIPVQDKRFIHFLCAGIWAAAEPNDILMPEVGIGCEINQFYHLLLYGAYGYYTGCPCKSKRRTYSRALGRLFCLKRIAQYLGGSLAVRREASDMEAAMARR